MSEKTVFVIPGFRQKADNKAYKEIAKILKGEGYRPILTNIPWKQTTISENTAYFLKQFKKIKTKEKYILGFSFGAMIAFIASTKVKVSGLILCSLSPYFQEDVLKDNNKWASSISTARYEDFSKLHAGTLAKNIKSGQTHFLYGAKEAKTLIKRVTETYGHIRSTRKHLIPIREAEHNIGDKRYLYKIQQIAKTLH